MDVDGLAVDEGDPVPDVGVAEVDGADEPVALETVLADVLAEAPLVDEATDPMAVLWPVVDGADDCLIAAVDETVAVTLAEVEIPVVGVFADVTLIVV